MGDFLAVAGDLHGDFGRFNMWLNKRIRLSKRIREEASQQPDYRITILQTGDLGYWPHSDPAGTWYSIDEDLEHPASCPDKGIKTHVDFAANGFADIYWCAGNHENHDALDALEARWPDNDLIQVAPHVWYARFGAVLTLLDGTRTMFCGGAMSHDIDDRVPGKEWWPGEAISEKDMSRLPPEDSGIDCIVSHTAPTGFRIPDGIDRGDSDPSRDFLEIIRKKYRPKKWFFGHFHANFCGYTEGCEWKCMDMASGSRKWIERI